MVQEKQIVVRGIPSVLWQRLKAQAALENRTLQDVVAAAIELYLKRAA